LKRCYEIAPPRIRKYLDAEVQYALRRTPRQGRILELGCGYGRFLKYLAKISQTVVGIDISLSSLGLARQLSEEFPACYVAAMNAVGLGFRDNTFDRVVCIQNGISAFHVDQRALIEESIRVTKDGGLVLFSSYSDKIWPARLHWFELQAEAGLIGEIDREQTRDGVIVCRDGFKASTISAECFRELTADLQVNINLEEIDDSSVFCVLTVRKDT
jgi:2-polyprenyl-6-hydroxyphenyl methylase/3-demethylubiquinone-9 3-methyltransferase